jgi:hypothetical protein
MEHLIILIVKFILKLLADKPSGPSAPLAGQAPRAPTTPFARPSASTPADVWEQYRQKQIAMEKELARKAPRSK